MSDYHQWFGFEKVMAYRVLAGMLFSHVPVHPSQFYRFTVNVHGHTHHKNMQMTQRVFGSDAWEQVPDPRYVNVCVDAPGMNYTPISLEDIQARVR